MELTSIQLTIVISSGLALLALGWSASTYASNRKLGNAKSQAEDILTESRKEADRTKHKVVLQAREEWFNKRDEQEKRLKGRQKKLEQAERELLDKERKHSLRENEVQQLESHVLVRERDLKEQKDALKTKELELNRLIQRENLALSRVAQMSQEECKTQLLENLRREYKAEAAEIYKELVDKTKENARKEARKIITMAIEKTAAEHSVETTVSVVSLPSEEVKGRIIGRDGRNIKAFETATGVKVIVDDTPEAVVLSGFDPVRREVARVALEKIIKDNKVNPQKIEEIVKNAEKEVDKLIWRAGNEVIARLGVGRMQPDMIRILGRLKYRTSYGQNVLQHSEEVAGLTGAMAAELKLNVKLAKRAGLLHDIGKAMSQNIEGTHTQIGIEIGQKFNEDEVVLNAIASHHEDEAPTSLISELVCAADAISGARPGARRDSLDGYVRRIESLEKLANFIIEDARGRGVSIDEIQTEMEKQSISWESEESVRKLIFTKVPESERVEVNLPPRGRK